MAQANYEPLPIDLVLLRMLPDEGLLGGVHYVGRFARDVTEELNASLPDEAAPLSVHYVQARLRAMRQEGLVERFHTASAQGKKIWARTAMGRAFGEERA